MIDGIAEQVGQRRFQPIEDVPIDLRVFTNDFEPHFLAERTGQVAHHSRKALSAIGKGTHARAQDLEIQAVGKVGGAPIEQIQLLDPLGEEALAIANFMQQFA